MMKEKTRPYALPVAFGLAAVLYTGACAPKKVSTPVPERIPAIAAMEWQTKEYISADNPFREACLSMLGDGRIIRIHSTFSGNLEMFRFTDTGKIDLYESNRPLSIYENGKLHGDDTILLTLKDSVESLDASGKNNTFIFRLLGGAYQFARPEDSDFHEWFLNRLSSKK